MRTIPDRIEAHRHWALHTHRPVLAWITPTGAGYIWLDLEYVTVKKPRPYPGAGGVTKYDWHDPLIIHEKIRPGLKDRYLKGLTKSKKMVRQIIWYMATDGENITDEWRNDSYGQYY